MSLDVLRVWRMHLANWRQKLNVNAMEVMQHDHFNYLDRHRIDCGAFISNIGGAMKIQIAGTAQQFEQGKHYIARLKLGTFGTDVEITHWRDAEGMVNCALIAGSGPFRMQINHLTPDELRTLAHSAERIAGEMEDLALQHMQEAA